MSKPRLMSVMAPLTVADENLGEFKGNLIEAAGIGVEAVTVDVWWGKVMVERGRPVWSYYKNIFQCIKEANLLIVPIISFHRCGGGPGDDCDIPMPHWLYSEVSAEAGFEADDLRYESETGRKCSDYLPPWITSNPAVKAVMKEFMDSFSDQDFIQQLVREKKIAEINISMGPTGELRYPSYNKADGWPDLHRGFFQAYSNPARASFRKWAIDNDKTWARAYRDSPFAIRPPFGHIESDFNIGSDPFGPARADYFVYEKEHKAEGYGRDFIQWYHESLLEHCKSLMESANASFGGEFANIPLGLKIPGIHWQWRSTDVPRYAELTAGLMPYHPNLKSGDNPDSELTGYESIFDCVSKLKESLKREIVVHFTALEMDDDQGQGNTSMAQTLVKSVGETAKEYAVILSGENASPRVADTYPGDDKTWLSIRKAFDGGNFSGFTLLRLCEDSWNTDKDKLAEFIKDYDID